MRAKYGEPKRWLEAVALAESDACVEWPFGTTQKGYGYVRIGASRMHAHRYVCLIAHGVQPSSAHTDVAHSCGNRKCCNPKHLRHATSLENSADAVSHGTVPRGDNHPIAKLREADIPHIRRAMREGVSLSAVARQYGVSHKTISFIRDGVTWGWVDAA